MRDGARLAAAIEVLEAIAATDRAADRVLDRYLKDRRYIGGGDRGEIARRVWGVLRRRARLDWWIKKRSEEHTSELQSLMRSSYAVFCLKKKKEQHGKV